MCSGVVADLYVVHDEGRHCEVDRRERRGSDGRAAEEGRTMRHNRRWNSATEQYLCSEPLAIAVPGAARVGDTLRVAAAPFVTRLEVAGAIILPAPERVFSATLRIASRHRISPQRLCHGKRTCHTVEGYMLGDRSRGDADVGHGE
jgi:hypothetical protein